MRLSEVVEAITDALGHSIDAPEASRARDLTARAGWRPSWASWEDLLYRIGDEDYPPPGLANVVDDYSEA